MEPKKVTGFQTMEPDRLKELASIGGKRAHALLDYDVAGGNSFNGDVFGYYIAKTALTGTELSNFQTYISNKLGI